VILGDNPTRNYTELARKFPHFFSKTNMTENFDQGVFQIASSLAEAFYTDQNLIKLSKRLESFKNLEIMKKFDEFYNLFNEKDKWDMMLQSELNSFITLGRGFFHNRLSISGSRSELMHLFFSLLSPHFHFNHDRLVADLLIHFTSLGGEFKKLNFKSFKFSRGKLASFEFESFEGMINPGHLVFIGGEPIGMPITFKDNKLVAYNTLEVKLEMKDKLPLPLQGKKILFSSPIKTGTNWPFWQAWFQEDRIVFNLVMQRRQGLKEEFISNKVIKILLEDLEFLYPEYTFTIEKSEFKFTLDVLIEDNNILAHRDDTPRNALRPSTVYSKISPISFFKLKNVSYLGPYRGNTHGIFSALIELQKSMGSM
jgi:hypothetical protein